MPALAQAVPPGGGAAPIIPPSVSAPLQAPPTERVLPPEQPQVLPPTPPPSAGAVEPPEGGPVRVDEIRIQGVTVYDAGALRAEYAGAVGAAVPRIQLDEIVRGLQTRYREDGYILTVVRGSFEKGNNGRVVFVIQAVEGYIGDVKLDGDIGPAATLVYRMLNKLTDKRPVNNADLERALLLANDVPGVSVKAVLRRESGEPGAIQLIAQLSRKSLSGFATYDNRGSHEAGPNEMLLSGATNSFTNFGERLEALLFSTLNREQIFGQVNGDAFLTADGLHLHVFFGDGNNQPGGILKPTGFNGDISIAGGELSYPVFRSRRFNLSVNTDVDTYNTDITLAALGATGFSASHLTMWRGGSSGDLQDALFFDLPAATSLNIKVTHGLVGTSDTRPGNVVHFTKVAGDLTRVQNLFTLVDVPIALKASVGGQYTRDILPTSEKFYLGGTRFGRGFFNGEVTGDKAIGSTTELQENVKLVHLPFTPPDLELPAQFYQFFDYGHAFNLGPGDLDFSLRSAGLGVRSDLTSWLFLELEGLHRFTTHPQGLSVAVEAEYAFFTRVTAHY
ncbi:MAG: ShlB/FhaC/HecB family hemolysin secretion/activation protein [Alphaproteobacteria bacterium]|nr:ShlB/FhaC/HecB family hemolysin secretion/activation protein [Alphaproteobacteria bacterium]